MPLKKAEPAPVVCFETPPGKQKQADFTTVRRGRVVAVRSELFRIG